MDVQDRPNPQTAGRQQAISAAGLEESNTVCAAAREIDHHPIHAAATRGDVAEVRRLLDGDPNLVDLGDALPA
jgi:hypothetical protein